MNEAMTPMPKYRSHKEVWALQIESVEDNGTDTTTDENQQVTVHFSDKRFAPRKFNLRGKPTPEAGWYFIQYADGYESFSPAKAFAEGYVLILERPFYPGQMVSFSEASGNAPLAVSARVQSSEQHNGMTFYRLEGFMGLFLASSLFGA